METQALHTPLPRHHPSLNRKPSHAAVWLLVALGLLFVSSPFVHDWRYGAAAEAALLSLVMLFAVLAVAQRRRTLMIALLLVAPALAARWLHHVSPGMLSPVVSLVAAMVFFAFVALQIFLFVLHCPRVDANALCAGLSGYLILGLLWLPAYVIVGQLNPSAFVLGPGAESGATFDGFRAFYFSFITLCTVGYGDVVPVSKVARMLAVTEAIAGLFYVAVLISRLVAIYSSPPPPVESMPGDGVA
jgi:hypothetical protein